MIDEIFMSLGNSNKNELFFVCVLLLFVFLLSNHFFLRACFVLFFLVIAGFGIQAALSFMLLCFLWLDVSDRFFLCVPFFFLWGRCLLLYVFLLSNHFFFPCLFFCVFFPLFQVLLVTSAYFIFLYFILACVYLLLFFSNIWIWTKRYCSRKSM